MHALEGETEDQGRLHAFADLVCTALWHDSILERSNRSVILEDVIHTLSQIINLVTILHSTDTCLPLQVKQAVFRSSTKQKCPSTATSTTCLNSFYCVCLPAFAYQITCNVTSSAVLVRVSHWQELYLRLLGLLLKGVMIMSQEPTSW